MPPVQPAKLLRIHIAESDRYGGKPLYEAIVNKCREMQIAGATVFRGLEGYGETAEMHKHRLTRHDQPILISIIDTAENLARLTPVVEEMMDTGLLATSEVRILRVQKKAPAGQVQRSPKLP
jgi:PII-like signaling protein